MVRSASPLVVSAIFHPSSVVKVEIAVAVLSLADAIIAIARLKAIIFLRTICQP
jgi:hypothetical protein